MLNKEHFRFLSPSSSIEVSFDFLMGIVAFCLLLYQEGECSDVAPQGD